MTTYEIVGQIDTVALKASYGMTWYGLRLTPPFWLQAGSKTEAQDIAREIIDPLDLCKVHITAKEMPDIGEADLRGMLDEAVGALNGDSNDREHDALYGIAGTLADILGMRLNNLLVQEDEE